MRTCYCGVLFCALLLACSGDDRGEDPIGGVGGSGGIGGSGGSGGTSGAGAGGTSGQSGAGGLGGTAGVIDDAGSDAGDASDPIDSGSDSGMVSTGPFAIDALPFPLELAEPIAAPERQWSFVAFPESRCANGTPTGIAINPIADAQGLLVFMQGGGACWNTEMCFVTMSSVHLADTVDETVVLGEAANLSGLFDHDNAANPFKDYAYVYMPYCTGDVHIGTSTKVYEGANGGTIHHYGARNVAAFLARLVPTFPEIDRVVVSGISAGGFGATFNWWRYQGAFPYARVDVLDDAGLIVDAPDDRWSIMVDAWQMALPPGCDACTERMSAFLPLYGEHLVAPRRYALVGFMADAVIGQFFGLTGEEIGAELLARRAAATGNQKTFFLAGAQHSIIAEGAFTMASDGATFLPWLLQYATDDSAWDHAGP